MALNVIYVQSKVFVLLLISFGIGSLHCMNYEYDRAILNMYTLLSLILEVCCSSLDCITGSLKSSSSLWQFLQAIHKEELANFYLESFLDYQECSLPSQKQSTPGQT